ncbi:MAG TPA: amino acid adenylation domain-containing protein [Candidatus Baltobacteraceae bacterium]|jgi:D-alanine--poly(phosphoribitol) ligase subunit 1
MKPYSYNVGLEFGAVARDHARRPALRFPDGREVSYAELDDRVNRFASELIRRGLRRGDVMGIVHTKTLDCFAAMLGALKVGAAYLNLDDLNPAARLEHILSTAAPAFVVAQTVPDSVRDAAAHTGIPTFAFDDPAFARAIEAAPAGEPATCAAVTGSDPAYVMFTSGSTGVPKGAIVTHGNLLSFASWCGMRFGFAPGDFLTNLNPLHFDFSVSDVYGALLNGAAVVPIARETLANPSLVLEQVERSQCTSWGSVPSLVIYLTTLNLLAPDRLPAIRQFIFCGEVYPKPELRKLFAMFGHRSKLINAYGPTECTCFCSAWDIEAGDLEDLEGTVPLGHIAENCSAVVLDDGREVGPGEIGELYVMGPQVGLGYINDFARTQGAFVANPVNARWPERAYKTGDLVRLGQDGRTLVFVGRADNQIKHMGYRIELEEIEAAINRLDGVVQSAVVHKADGSGMKIIVAYVAPDDALTKAELRARLRETLPAYMIPQNFELRKHLPKNANGKVDRVALAAQ